MILAQFHLIYNFHIIKNLYKIITNHNITANKYVTLNMLFQLGRINCFLDFIIRCSQGVMHVCMCMRV